jgi:protein O-mannosyl-transferase
MTGWFSGRNYILLFISVGLITYAHSLINGFVWDDYNEIVNNTFLHNLDIVRAFLPNAHNTGMFYRPVTLLYLELVYFLVGQQAFVYHLLQLALHITNTILLFILFARLFPRALAGVLALLFLVHPINVESVAWISATNTQLSFVFGISALLLGTEPQAPIRRVIIVGALTLLSVLSKEVGILFLVLILLYRYVYKLGKLVEFGSLGVVIGITYLLMRITLGKVVAAKLALIGIPISVMPLMERLANSPAIVLYYLKTFLIPWNLSIWQVWVNRADLQGFVIPLLICLVIGIGLVGYLVYRLLQEDESNVPEKSGVRTLGLFICWYVIGMAVLIQVIPLEMTVADRWFYFPMVGLLGIIGTLLQPHWHTFQKRKKLYLIVIIVIISLLAIRTFVRVSDWKDNLTLYEHDARVDPQNEMLADGLAYFLVRDKRVDEALIYEKRAVALSPNPRNLTQLGKIYSYKEQHNEAIQTYTWAIQMGKDYKQRYQKEYPRMIGNVNEFLLDDYTNLAATYFMLGRVSDAKMTIEDGLRTFPKAAVLYYNLSLVEEKLGDNEKASEALEKAQKLNPNVGRGVRSRDL